MSALLPAFVPALAAILVLLLAGRGRVAVGIGLLGLAAAWAMTFATTPGEQVTVGGSLLAVTEYGRSLGVLLATAGLLVGGAAVAAGTGPAAMAAMLAGLAAAWLGLITADPAIGGWMVLAGSAAAIACTLLAGRVTPDLPILVAALRAVTVAGALGVAGMAIAAPVASGGVPDPSVGAIAFLIVGGALTLRMAAVPLHGWAARLADAVPLPSLAVMLAWLPAVATVLVLIWSDVTLAPVAADLGVERAILVAVALASLVFGPLAAVIGDDLGHVTAYLAIAATGLGLLGVSAIDPGAWAPTRAWMAMTAVSATGLVAFSMVLGRAYGTRWLPDLRGWARRSPVLAVAFAILGLAMVGAPGMAALDARTALVDGAVEGPLTAVARLLLIAPLVPLLRVLVLGLAPIGATVRDGRSEWPRRPERWTAREPAAIADRARALATDAAVTGRLDRLPAASAIVLVLALLAGLVASGAIDLAAAAAEPAPGVTSPFEPGAGELSPDGELDGGEATPGPDGSAGQGDVSPSP